MTYDPEERRRIWNCLPGSWVLGFVPSLAPNEMLFGTFHVNAAHNIVYLASGAVALICGLTSSHASLLYFHIFGFVYGLVAILGIMQGDTKLLGLISNNIPRCLAACCDLGRFVSSGIRGAGTAAGGSRGLRGNVCDRREIASHGKLFRRCSELEELPVFHSRTPALRRVGL